MLLKSLFLVGMVGCCYAIMGVTTDSEKIKIEKLFSENKNVFDMNSVCLQAVQKQMNAEKYASLVYKQMAAYFANPNVAKLGFAKLFNEQSKEEAEHFDKIMNYINLRGERVNLFEIDMPKKSAWENVNEALAEAIALELQFANDFDRIHSIAETTCKDVHLVNFLENEFIDEQVDSINKLLKLRTIVTSAGPGLGEHLVDRELADGKLSLETL